METFLLMVFLVLFIIILVKLSRLNNVNSKIVEKLESISYKLQKLEEKLSQRTSEEPVEKTEISESEEVFTTSQPNLHTVPIKEVEEQTILETLPQVEPENVVENKIAESEDISKQQPEVSIFQNLIHTKSIEKTEEEDKKKTFQFEKLFGENILSKVGITTLVLGIAYFVKYAIDKNWIGETGRLAIGILVGIGIIGIAHKLRKKYLAFSALLAGGGISVFYITITIAYREYEIFSQPLAFFLLIIVSLISVSLSLFYNEKILAVFSLLGGFASPLLVSSGSGNYITLFSYIFILNLGMLVLAYKKKWKLVSIHNYVLTFVFYIFWLIFFYEDDNRKGATVFNLLFFIQFYILVFIEFIKDRKFTPFQVAIILSNNFILYFSFIYIFKSYPINVKGIITLFMAGINLIPVVMLFLIKQKDTLFFRLLLGVVITFITLAIPIQLEGSVITMFWGVESVLLFWLFKNTGIEIFKKSFYILFVITILSLLNNYVNYYLITTIINEAYNMPIIVNPIFITATLIILCLFINLYMIRNCHIEEKKFSTLDLKEIKILYKCIIWFIWGLLFIFPITELTYQLQARDYSFYQVALLQGLFIYIYAAIFYFVNHKEIKYISYVILGGLIILYSIIYLLIIISRGINERFYYDNFSLFIYLLHYLTIPLYIYLVKLFCSKNINSNNEIPFWLAAISSLIALSVEIDNTVLIKYSYKVLFDIHTIAYPIVWGISGLILIFIGMKKNKVIFRKISLALFGLIILKLYLYDVWQMSQTGKIISFILLGIILLSTSFLYQKLKILVKNEDEVINDEANTEDR